MSESAENDQALISTAKRPCIKWYITYGSL